MGQVGVLSKKNNSHLLHYYTRRHLFNTGSRSKNVAFPLLYKAKKSYDAKYGKRWSRCYGSNPRFNPKRTHQLNNYGHFGHKKHSASTLFKVYLTFLCVSIAGCLVVG